MQLAVTERAPRSSQQARAASDFGQFQRCLTGPETFSLEPECTCFDREDDDDVDQSDFSFFHSCMSGANVIADPYCAE